MAVEVGGVTLVVPGIFQKGQPHPLFAEKVGES